MPRLPTTEVPDAPDPPTEGVEHAAPTADAELQAYVRVARWRFLAAAAVASPVLVAATWSLADGDRLLGFLALHLTAVLAMALTFALPVGATDDTSMPPLWFGGIVLAQAVLSSIPFFDSVAAERADFTFAVAMILFAFAAGTVATLAPMRNLAAAALVATFLPFTVAAAIHGHVGIAVGTGVFVAVTVGSALPRSGRLFDEVRARGRLASERAHEAEAIATTDGLTGLTNRYGLDQLDGTLLQREIFGIFIDLDRFKAVNDTLGHRAGDHVLVQVAKRLQRYVRPSDTVARLGGDEFFILLWSDHEIPVMDIANRIRVAIDGSIRFEGQVVDVSASIGVSRQSPGVLNLEALVQGADEALYMAKSLGRNQVIAASVRLNARAGISTPSSERSNGTT